jgi:hypothetical protein
MNPLELKNPVFQYGHQNLEEILQQEAEAAQAKLKAEETPTDAGLPTYLTPESLVAYCDTRLTSLDSQMQAIFNQQQTNSATETALGNLATALNDLPQPSGSNTTVNVSLKQMSQLWGTYQTAIDAAGPTTALGKELTKDQSTLQNAWEATGGSVFYVKGGPNPSCAIDESTITNCSQNVKTYASNLNSDSQVSMINLQSMMSQQQTAVELSTNLLQTLSQTTNNIAANMKA